MKGLNDFISKININDFKYYFVFSILFVLTLVFLGNFEFTQARYENTTEINVTPTLAFFIVDVESQTGQIKLDSMIPRNEPYLYSFNVSNFLDNRRANVDLTYSIEIITTTNLPLNFKIFKGTNMQLDTIDSDTVETDSNGVYYRHLVIDDASIMQNNTNCTDVYTLWVEFPKSYENSPEDYPGIIDLVDIKIDSEQVV